MIRFFAVITIILLVLTLGCGFVIHYGGESFKNAVKGHMVLGVLTLLSALALLISIFKN
jgi:hypothetical protein